MRPIRILLISLAALIVLLGSGTVSTATSVDAPRGSIDSRSCDRSGDGHGRDCVSHRMAKRSADRRVRPGGVISVATTFDRSLRGRNVHVDVQARARHSDSTFSNWITIRRVLWTSDQTAKRATRTIDVCTAALAGHYQFRTQVSFSGRARSTATATATSAPTGLTVAPPTGNSGCTPSPDDETIVEYFNEVNFNDGFSIDVVEQGASFALTLSCPQPESAIFPPASFAFGLWSADQQVATMCGQDVPIVIPQSALESGGPSFCSGYLCDFVAIVYNSATGSIYGTTNIQLNLQQSAAAGVVIPNLEPATVPICDGTLNPCILEGTCQLATTKTLETLQLCESAASCTPAPATLYVYNESIFFNVIVRPSSQ